MRKLRVLIVGGYGTCGGRLARLLADESRLAILIAGRDLSKAREFCAQLPTLGECEAVIFDREGDVAEQISRLGPDLVVDASGPFQLYGENPYRLARACIEYGCHYMDFADGAAFVAGIGKLDEAARAKDVFVLSGVSTFPALTAAAVRELARNLASVDDIRVGTVPSRRATSGRNMVRAVASYAGKSVPLVRAGQSTTGRACIETHRHTIAPPGFVPLKSAKFSLADAPELRVLPELWPGLGSIWAGIALPAILRWMLKSLSWLVRLRLVRSLGPFAGLFRRLIRTLGSGDDRGGLFVEISGRRSSGEEVVRSWHLIAEGDDVRSVPSVAAETIIRLMLIGRIPSPGARPATSELEIPDFEDPFRRNNITTGTREQVPAEQPLYRRVLADAWWRLPSEVLEMHDFRDSRTAEGVAQIERGPGKRAALAATLFGLPRAGRDVPFRMTFERTDGGEIWTRSFAGRQMRSVQAEGAGKDLYLIRERFGAVSVSFALVLQHGRLRFVVRRWSFFGVPLPLSLAPYGDATEFAEAGRFRFYVEVRHIFTGLIVRYQGWLVPND